MKLTKTASKAAEQVDGYLRIAQIVPNIIPVSRRTWWRWVEQGYAPAPARETGGATFWLRTDIQKWVGEDLPSQERVQ